MAKVFGETSTTDEVLSGVNLKGKRVLVTGFLRDSEWRPRVRSLRMELK
jgi:hypothetical protein